MRRRVRRRVRRSVRRRVRPGVRSSGPSLAAALRRWAPAALLALVLLGALPSGLGAQEDSLTARIERSQQRLEQIRNERDQLRQEMSRLENQVHAVSEEISNLEQRIRQSASVVEEIRVQLSAVEEQVDRTTRELLHARDRLTAGQVELRARLEEIYKRGDRGPVQVLLGSESFSDLLNRYKYLHLVTLHDRILVNQVKELEDRLSGYRSELSSQREWLESLRRQRTRELQELEQLRRQRRQRLQQVRARRSRAEDQIASLTQEEEDLRQLLAQLEKARRRAERETGAASTSTLRTSDVGQLDWPVQGEVVYDYGPDRREGSTTMREGIGIGAEPGTPVRAVEAGEVVWAGPRGLYGPSVIVSHGGGYYSLYLYLQGLRVNEGEQVQGGQVVGEVGGVGSPEGPHVEFQIREPSSSGEPRAVDPVKWLRNRQ